MQLHKKEEVIDIKKLYKKVSDVEIYNHYLNGVKLNTMVNSPFRLDRHPSFVVYVKNGECAHKDMGDCSYRGDAVDFVMQLFNINIKTALEKIYVDFGILEGVRDFKRVPKIDLPVVEDIQHSFIQVTAKKWDKKSLEYWLQYGITKAQLIKEKIYNVKEWYLNRIKQFIGEDELCFAYGFDNQEGFKIYYPLREKGQNKWFSNISTQVVENIKALNTISPVVIIVKSRKDRLTLQHFFPRLCILSVQNESNSAFTKEFVELLKNKVVYISYDTDPPGKKASLALTKTYGFKHINVPDAFYKENGLKDWSDVYVVYGSRYIIEHFNKKLCNGKK